METLKSYLSKIKEPLVPIKRIKPESTRYIIGHCKNRETGQECFVKFFDNTHGDGHKNGFLKDIVITKVFAEEYALCPKVIFANLDDPIYLCSEFLHMPHPKIFAAEMKPDLIDRIMDALKTLQSAKDAIEKVRHELLGFIKPKVFDTWDYREYERNVRYSLEELCKNGNIKERFMRRVLQILSKADNAIDEAVREQGVLAHGDFSISNTCISQNKVYLLDFEHSRIDNKLSDVIQFMRDLYTHNRQDLAVYLENKIRNDLYFLSIPSFDTLYTITVIEKFLAFMNYCKDKKTPESAEKYDLAESFLSANLAERCFYNVIVKKYIKRVKNNPLTPFDKGE